MRLFVGVEIPAGVREAVEGLVERQRRGLPPARWVKPDNYHLTLVFLGEQESTVVGDLEAALTPVFSGWQPFRVQLARTGSFPPAGPARVLWIGLEQQGEIQQLQSSVVAALRGGMTLREEKRPYHPHLTVARCRWPWPRVAVKRWVASLPDALGDDFVVERGILYESRLAHGGARYEQVREFAFESTE